MSKNKKHRTKKKTAVTKNVSSQSSQILKILQQAQQYQKAGDWQKAEALCHQVLQKQPKNDSALNFYKQLSAALNSKGRTTEALAYLQRALSFNPNHAEMQNDLGIIFGQQGKLDQAKACFEKAIAGKKDFVQAYYNLGIILNGEEQFAQAITCYQKALSITPNYADAYNNLGNALSGQNKFSEAIINYQKAVALNPNYAEAHNNLGVAFKKQGQITESIACFKQAIDLKGNYTDAENNLAVTLNEQRQFEPDNANSYGGLTGASNNTPWKVVNGYPIEGVPPDFELPPIVGENNDYSFIEEKRKAFVAGEQPYTLPVSIIIPVYNRKEKLAKTLAAITHQTYPANLIEVIVADDGSSDGVEEVIEKYQKYLSLKSVRQDDQGYRLSAVRNLGLNLAQYDHISILDCDILPTPKYLELLMQYFHVTDKAALMGHRRFVCTDNIADDQILADVNIALNLPDVMPSDKNDRPKKEGEPIIDHRFRLYEQNDYLKQSLFPFSAFYGCSMTFPKKVIGEVGPFDEDFQAWGHEDVEMGYRIYNAGYYFIPVLEAMGLHQEPPGGENESNRSEGLQITNHLLAQKCPIARQYQANVVYEIPKVSIYMAAYNAEKYIKRAVDSALAQTYTDLEVCIVNDGSTDNTLKVLEQNYQNNPRVRWISQKNSGVANTFNAAVGLCRGMYLAHLDADDILLRLDAVEIMVKYLDTYNVGCLYSSCHMIDVNNMTTGKWDSFPVFCREKFINSMIVSHFRLFRKRDWERLDGGFDETLENAEDFDLFLRLSEICPFHHIQEVFYGYRLHGENASIVFQEKQTEHHNLIIQQALKRNGMDKEWEAYVPDPKKPRTTLFRKKVLDAQTESSVVDKLYEYAFKQPDQGHPQDYIFVLSHMRSYSSLLCHILGSHSEISGYSEMHSSYLELSDLLTLKQKVAVATDNHLPNRFVLDKILNPSVNTSESILNNEHVHVIFLLRNPEDTIKSIINMGINLNVGAQMEWCKDVEKVLVYYINRLKQIENYSLKMQKSALFIASEKILDDSEQTLKQLTGFLGLKTKLEKDYSIFKYTGLRGHGDPSAVIKEGKMIHQKSHYDIHIPSYILAQAQKSYDNCYRVLSKHPDSQTRESYHSYHDVLPKHLLFQSKNMNDTVIQSLWIGNKLSKLEQLSIASFLYHGHQFHLYTYNDISGIPDGTQLKDANEIILERDIFTYYNGSYAGFADWFRWALLFKNGNFWVDTDVICLKPFNFDTNLIFGFSNVDIVGPAVLGFPPKHDLCRFLENNCRNPNTFLPYDSKKIKDKKLKRRLLGDKRSHIDWGEAGGPVGFTQALKHFNLLHLAKPFTYFFPIPYTNWDYVFDETLAHETELFSNSYAIYLYNEMMRRKKDFDKNASFPELSLIEQLKKKYL